MAPIFKRIAQADTATAAAYPPATMTFKITRPFSMSLKIYGISLTDV